jgi:D-sedoheptulose 7-phosphate isomerase
MDEQHVHAVVARSLALKRRFFAEHTGRLLEIGRLMCTRLRAGGKILVFGNGGSAADAQHFAGELVGRFRRERPGIAAVALGADPSIVTAVGNDLGFERVFARQLEALGRAGDVAFAISTSGRSPNVLAALRLARERGLVTVGLTGEGGGDAAALVDHLIAVPDTDTPRIQEVHGMVVHVLCELIEEELQP